VFLYLCPRNLALLLTYSTSLRNVTVRPARSLGEGESREAHTLEKQERGEAIEVGATSAPSPMSLSERWQWERHGRWLWLCGTSLESVYWLRWLRAESGVSGSR
jgi:hypothetical protein